MHVCHPPDFDFVQHAFGFLVGHTNQGLLVNGNELISRPQTSILHKKKTKPSVMLGWRTTLCLHLVILPVFVPWVHLILKGMTRDLLIGYCISCQTHTHELMKWVWTADRRIRPVPGAQRDGRSFLCWQEMAKVEFWGFTQLESIKTFVSGICASRRRQV